MHIDNLYFEVTRRCNMKCSHCLRGCAQKVDLTIDVVDRFLRLNEVTSIGRIGFSGGEPSLNSRVIRETVALLERLRIGIGSFDITTNGKAKNLDFFLAVAELFAYANSSYFEEESSELSISRSYWHAEQGQDESWIDTLKAFRFTRERSFLDYDPRFIISDGRAKRNSLGSRKTDQKATIGANRYRDGRMELDDSMIYINALGQVCADCDYSYATQKRRALGDATKDRLIDIAVNHGNVNDL